LAKNLSRSSPRPQPPSKVFRNMSGTKIANLTLDDYDNLIGSAYLEEENIQFLSDMASIMRFQEKPRGLQLTIATQSGLVNSATPVTLLEVPAGRTFDIQCVTMILNTLTSGSNFRANYYLSIQKTGELAPTSYLLKSIFFDGTEVGYTIDFSTMGDFLVSGQPGTETLLTCALHTGTTNGSIGGHNVFYREVN
jgi:hypothetical protein